MLHFMDRTGLGHDRCNFSGGGIAMGHPTGATGVIRVNTPPIRGLAAAPSDPLA